MPRITPIAVLHLHVISELLFRFTYTLWIWVFVEWFFGSESRSTLYSSLWTSSSPWTPLSVKIIIDVNYLLLCSLKNQINKMVPNQFGAWCLSRLWKMWKQLSWRQPSEKFIQIATKFTCSYASSAHDLIVRNLLLAVPFPAYQKVQQALFYKWQIEWKCNRRGQQNSPKELLSISISWRWNNHQHLS